MSVLITFIQKAIMQGICMLFGADGEILRKLKSWCSWNDVHGRNCRIDGSLLL